MTVAVEVEVDECNVRVSCLTTQDRRQERCDCPLSWSPSPSIFLPSFTPSTFSPLLVEFSGVGTKMDKEGTFLSPLSSGMKGAGLTRVQKQQLRSIMVGSETTTPSPFITPLTHSDPYLHPPNAIPIIRLTGGDVVKDEAVGTQVAAVVPKEADFVRVPDNEMQVFSRSSLRDLFSEGEDQLQDLQTVLGTSGNAMCEKKVTIPCPEVEEVDERRYDQWYPEVYDDDLDDMPLQRTQDPPMSEVGLEDEYDLDDEDDEFLIEKRDDDPNFRVTNSIFEDVISFFLKKNWKTVEDFETLRQQSQGDSGSGKNSMLKIYPISSLSLHELNILVAYFLDKSSTSKIPWQPIVTSCRPMRKSKGGGSLTSPIVGPSTIAAASSGVRSPYTVFRSPIIKAEPRVTRSQKNIVSFFRAKDIFIASKAQRSLCLVFKMAMKQFVRSGVATHHKVRNNLCALEDAWREGLVGEEAVAKFNFTKERQKCGDNDDTVKTEEECQGVFDGKLQESISVGQHQQEDANKENEKENSGIHGVELVNKEIQQSGYTTPPPRPKRARKSPLRSRTMTSSPVSYILSSSQEKDDSQNLEPLMRDLNTHETPPPPTDPSSPKRFQLLEDDDCSFEECSFDDDWDDLNTLRTTEKEYKEVLAELEREKEEEEERKKSPPSPFLFERRK